MARKHISNREIELEIGRAGLISNMDEIERSVSPVTFEKSREIILFRYPEKGTLKL